MLVVVLIVQFCVTVAVTLTFELADPAALAAPGSRDAHRPKAAANPAKRAERGSFM
jgi:hypothetical protein